MKEGDIRAKSYLVNKSITFIAVKSIKKLINFQRTPQIKRIYNDLFEIRKLKVDDYTLRDASLIL